MEPIGLAVGLVSLAGLFSTCLEALDKVDSWKNYEDEYGDLEAQYEAQKFVFKRWGQAVGLGEKDIHGKDIEISDDPRLNVIVGRLFESIKRIKTWGDGASSVPLQGADKSHTGDSRSNALFNAKMKKLRWSLRGKAKRILQVQRLTSIVDDLEKLIPTNGEKGQVSNYADSINTDDDTLNPDKWNTEFERILSKLVRDMEAKTRRDIQAWLLGGYIPDNIHWEKTQERTEDTCQWILSRPWFLDWLSPEFPDQRTKILWVHGPAGFGKSILCASVIDHLAATREPPVAYFFFSGKSQNTTDIFVAVRSWLTQMMSHPAAFDLIDESKTPHAGFKATNREILDLLQKVVTDVPGCTLIIDGLDECRVLDDDQDEYDNIEMFIQALHEATKGTQSHIMIFSRGEPQIRNFLGEGVKTHSVIEHRITSEDVRADVTRYSRYVVSKQIPRHRAEFKENISLQLAELCKGQFLWIRLQAKWSLRNGRGEKDLEQAVGDAPKDLEKRYEGDWQRIKRMSHRNRDRAVSLLRWVVFALRPLTVGEVTEAILIDQHNNEVHIDSLPDRVDEAYIDTELLYYCGSLIEVQSSNKECESAMKIVQLTHFSVKEFLMQKASTEGSILQPGLTTGYLTEQSQNTLIAMLCLRYILCPRSWGGNDILDGNSFGAFMSYAARLWHQHAGFGICGDSGLMALVKKLFDEGSSCWALWKRLFDETEAREDASKVGWCSSSPIYYAARLGLKEVTEYLIQDGKHDVDERGSFGQTALVAACETGRLDVIETLIAHQANIDIPTNDQSSPLDIALSKGHTEVAKFLIERGANFTGASTSKSAPIHVSAQRGYFDIATLLIGKGVDLHGKNTHGWTPLHAAAWGGFDDVCQALLANGALEDINVGNIDGWTPLHEAAHHGHDKTCDLLISNGANVKLVDHLNRTPIFLAAERGHLKVVELLLERDADIKIGDREEWSLIHVASQYGYIEVVSLLLERGVNIHDQNSHGWTPLHAAACGGFEDVCQLLLANGASEDINAGNVHSWTPLHEAARQGHYGICELLLSEGANVNLVDHRNRTSIYLASNQGHSEVVKLLLDNGADPTHADNDGLSPIHVASRNGSLDVMNLLLQSNPNVTIASNTGWTAMHFACRYGYLQIVQLLVQNGADIMVAKSDGWTPVHLASRNGHVEVVKLLLQNGAGHTVTLSTDDGWTPVHLASRYGPPVILELLLQVEGVNIHATNNGGWTPIQLAARNGDVELVKLLLQNEDEITAPVANDDGWIPIHQACRYGHFEVAELLLQNGADITITTGNGWTSIHLASRNGHVEVAKLLLQNGVGNTVTLPDPDGWTPVHLASRYGPPEILELLLQVEGVSVHTRTNRGWTPLHLASLSGDVELVKLLLHNGAGTTIAVANDSEWIPIHQACRYGHLEIVELLVQTRADVTITSPGGWTPLHHACRNGYLDIVKLLLRVEGVSVHAQNNHGWTPLHAAAVGGFVDICQILLANEADINASNVDGWTPLHEAAHHGHYKVCGLLLEKGANVRSADSQSRIPMDVASAAKRLEVVNLFQKCS